MNDHNLDDLIIDTNTPRQSKAKGFLTIIALFIVVLIVAIILTKIILKDPDTQQAALVEDNTEMISPELTLQSTPEEKTKETQALSEMIQDEIESPKEADDQKQHSSMTEETVLIDEERAEVSLPSPQQQKPSVKTETHPQKTPPQEKHISIPVKEKTPAATKKQPHTQAVSHKKSTQHASSAFYIQVGSFSKTPSADSRLLTAVRKNGYHYKIYASKGMKKVLIGPYRSRAEADRAIIRIKDRINKGAFVFTK